MRSGSCVPGAGQGRGEARGREATHPCGASGASGIAFIASAPFCSPPRSSGPRTRAVAACRHTGIACSRRCGAPMSALCSLSMTPPLTPFAGPTTRKARWPAWSSCTDAVRCPPIAELRATFAQPADHGGEGSILHLALIRVLHYRVATQTSPAWLPCAGEASGSVRRGLGSHSLCRRAAPGYYLQQIGKFADLFLRVTLGTSR